MTLLKILIPILLLSGCVAHQSRSYNCTERIITEGAMFHNAVNIIDYVCTPVKGK